MAAVASNFKRLRLQYHYQTAEQTTIRAISRNSYLAMSSIANEALYLDLIFFTLAAIFLLHLGTMPVRLCSGN